MTVLFIPHGGGPLPLLGEPRHAALLRFLGAIGARLPVPRAILVVSAHWEAAQPTLTGAAAPALLYDYFGFPQAAYDIDYPAPGAPAVAAQAAAALDAAGFAARVDAERGLDHGVFVPLKIMYPQAQVPVLQLSLLESLDPAAHLALGGALAPLRAADLLVLGSGFSFHNLSALMGRDAGPDAASADAANAAFEDWLVQTCTDTALGAEARMRRLRDWTQAPGARDCHPREEHLLPLHVCAGVAAGAAAEVVFDDAVMGKRTTAYLWR